MSEAIPDDLEELEEVGESDEDAFDDGLFELPHGQGLAESEVEMLLLARFCNVILFAGGAGCGKTTLLASLFLLFQRGPVAGYAFAGSSTLMGFNERNFHALCISNNTKPTTPRTTVSEYLHLQVRSESPLASPQDIILCDLLGEDFRMAKDSTEDCQRLSILRRADHLVLLVDGEKLASRSTRNAAKLDPQTLLRRCLDSGMVSARALVDVLVTKWDVVLKSSNVQDTEAFVDHLESEFQSLFSARVGALNFGRIAAQPFEADLPLGYGVTERFPVWARAFNTARKPQMPTPPYDAVSSQFDMYLQRVRPGVR